MQPILAYVLACIYDCNTMRRLELRRFSCNISSNVSNTSLRLYGHSYHDHCATGYINRDCDCDYDCLLYSFIFAVIVMCILESYTFYLYWISVGGKMNRVFLCYQNTYTLAMLTATLSLLCLDI